MASQVIAPQTVRTAGLIGLGAVGCGWAATYLARGFTVRAYDPAPEAAANARLFLTKAWPALRTLGVASLETPPFERLIVASLEETASQADIIHENAPEDAALKRDLLAQVERFCADNILICSSSGGLPPSIIQTGLATAHRVLVVHPFNPPHLIPLVEIIGGTQTSAEAVEWALSFMAQLGKHPIRIDREVTAYMANRLQFALLREAIHCVVEGVASPQAVEDAVRYGLGPRWAVMGALTTLTLAGGTGGMAKTISNFAPAMDSWFAALGSPSLTPDIQAKLVAASEQITGGRSIEEMIAQRDQNLVTLLQALPGAVSNRSDA